MPILSVSDLTITFSAAPVLDGASFHLDPGDRACIVGRNGAGKSTLLKIVSGEYQPNSGTVSFPQGRSIGTLQQDFPESTNKSVREVITSGLDADALADPELHWQLELRVEQLIKDLQLEADKPLSELSGGLKRRALLGKAIAQEPSLLVLDEPTNHLDIDSILWLEDYLLRSKLTLLFVTHDRAFLRKLATRIIDIDLGQLTSFRCGYDEYLDRKQDLIERDEKNRELFEKKLGKEEAWLRKGIKARRTRNEGRVKALKQMREEHRSWRTRSGNASITGIEGTVSGAKVITAKNASATLGGKQIIPTFDATIMRGDRIGIVGPNGSGKTTLLKLLLGKLQPSTGSVEHGTKLEIVYFDQMRADLDEESTLFDNIADGNETISVNGKQRHVITYLQDFLFTPDQARASLKTLSGGERNRLLLAKLFARPANLLVLDEPTNDLDAETLELLEERISEFQGTLILVSHDRAFLENTVTSLVILSEGGVVKEFPGGYEDWVRQGLQTSDTTVKRVSQSPSQSSRSTWKKRPTTLSNKQKSELDAIPAQIEKLETEKERLVELLADPATYQDKSSEVPALQAQMGEIEQKLETLFQRWEELETLRESLSDQAT